MPATQVVEVSEVLQKDSDRGSSTATENSSVSEKEAVAWPPSHESPTFLASMLVPWLGALVWPLMFTLPLALTTTGSPLHYTRIFPEAWYSYNSAIDSPKPLGLTLGILAVGVGQFWVCVFFYFFKYGYLSVNGKEPISIQKKGARPYSFYEGLGTHLAQPEGFGLLASYLTLTWMLNLMPQSYYSFEGGIQWKETFLCLVCQDAIQYLMHYLEHIVSAEFYKLSHKPHHRFTNPRLFDAFNGSPTDTICMILIPLISTAHIVRTCNVWTYMAFGSSYACWLTLIHSEYVFPWDPIFRRLGFGTPADHHVHHAVFKYNYGHLFMWFDQIGGTYRDPQKFAPKMFHLNV